MSKPAAVVTGGGRGLGRAIAERLAEDHAVLVVGRTEVDLKNVCDSIKSSGGAADYVVGDVSNSDTAQAALEALEKQGWDLRSLVCNAGIGKSRPLHEMEDTEWHATINTNLNGCFYFSKAVLPHFMEKKVGTLCFISSVAGVKGYAYESAYVASKHAVVGLAKSIALEYGKQGITAVAICPSFIEGEMTDRTIASLAKRRGISEEEAQKVIERLNPQRRIIPAEEVAEAVSFVCSNKVPSLGGSPLILSGGES